LFGDIGWCKIQKTEQIQGFRVVFVVRIAYLIYIIQKANQIAESKTKPYKQIIINEDDRGLRFK
jgi:hypothetical protein